MAIGVTAGTPVGATGGSNVTSINVSAPTLGANDLHVITVTVNATTATITTPTNYTLVGNTALGASGTSALYVFRRLGSAASGTVTLTAGSAGRIAAVPFTITGVDSTTPIEGTASTATSLVAPSKTASTGDLLITCYGVREGTGATAPSINTFTITQAAGMTEVAEGLSQIGNSTTQVASEAAYLSISAGATGTKTATTNATATALGGSLSFLVNEGVTTTTWAADASLGGSFAGDSEADVVTIVPVFSVTGLNVDSGALVPPTAPPSLIATAGNESITVTWDESTSTSDPVASYHLTLTAVGHATLTGDVAASEENIFSFTGLTNGVTYTVSITASNANGESEASTATATPAPPPEPPGVPENFEALALNHAVELTWDPPLDVGTASLDSYLIRISQASLGATQIAIVDSDETTLTVSNLANGQLATFSISAHNAGGYSEFATAETLPLSTPPGETPPTAVLNLDATGVDTAINAVWDAPTSSGSRTVTAYQVVITQLATNIKYYYLIPASLTSGVFAGLANDFNYLIEVNARSGGGDGLASSDTVDLTGVTTVLLFPNYPASFLPLDQFTDPDTGITEEDEGIVLWDEDIADAFPTNVPFSPIYFSRALSELDGLSTAEIGQLAPIDASIGQIKQLGLVEIYDNKGINQISPYRQRTLKLTPSFGAIYLRDVDWGYPDVRTAVANFSDSSGSLDETKYHGGRTITFNIVVLADQFKSNPYAIALPGRWNDISYWRSRLSQWMGDPARRYKLYVKMGEQSFFLDVAPRGINNSTMMKDRWSQEMQLVFYVPSGLLNIMDTRTQDSSEDARSTAEIYYGGSEQTGLTLPLTLPVEFPSSARSTRPVTNRGAVPVGFIARIFGDSLEDVEDPIITVQGPNGEYSQLGFTGAIIPTGASNYLEIDTIARDSYLVVGGVRGDRQNTYISSFRGWPRLIPGDNIVSYTSGVGYTPDPDTETYIQLLWNDAVTS